MFIEHPVSRLLLQLSRMWFLKSYIISLYSQCINNVNQVFPRRGKGISIAVVIHSLYPRLRGLVSRAAVGMDRVITV